MQPLRGIFCSDLPEYSINRCSEQTVGARISPANEVLCPTCRATLCQPADL
jgi:hypothetical protein